MFRFTRFFLIAFGILLSVLVSAAHSQTTFGTVTSAPYPTNGYPPESDGKVVDLSGDVNHDGILDIIVSSERRLFINSFFGITGGVSVYSGADLTSLTSPSQLIGLADDDGFGLTLGTGDFNKDGFADIVVGAPFFYDGASSGYIQIISGRDFSIIKTLYGDLRPVYDQFGDEIGTSMENLGVNFAVRDFNNDTYPDIVAWGGSYDNDGETGHLRIISGQNWSNLCSHVVFTEDRGVPILPFRDLNSDGKIDFAVATPLQSSNSLSANGKISFYSGANCQPLPISIVGTSNDQHLGIGMKLAGDMNGDAIKDLLLADRDGFKVYSGASPTTLLKTFNVLPLMSGVDRRATNSSLGISADYMSGFELNSDLNFDGTLDLVMGLGSFDWDESGRVQIVSGASASLIGEIKLKDVSSLEAYKEFPFASMTTINPSFDFNDDGLPDIVIAPGETYASSADFVNKASHIFIVSGTCPVEATLKHKPIHGSDVVIGSQPVEAEVYACTIKKQPSLILTKSGVNLPMLDTGLGGDRTANDKTVATTINSVAGAQSVRIQGLINNGIDIPIDETFTIYGKENYYMLSAPYGWVSVDGSDVAIQELIGQNNAAHTIQLPFSFNFYGKSYNSIDISTNGTLALGLPAGQHFNLGTNIRLPNLDLPTPLIAPLWSGFDNLATARIYYKTVGAPGTRQFIVTFEGFRFPPIELDGGVFTNSRVDFQTILFEGSNKIKINFKKVYSQDAIQNGGGIATSGIQASAHLGLTYVHNDSVIADQSAVVFSPTLDIPTTTPTATPTVTPTATQTPVGNNPTAVPTATPTVTPSATATTPPITGNTAFQTKFSAKLSKGNLSLEFRAFLGAESNVAPLSERACFVELYASNNPVLFKDKAAQLVTPGLLRATLKGAPELIKPSSGKKSAAKLANVHFMTRTICSDGITSVSPIFTLKARKAQKGLESKSWIRTFKKKLASARFS